MLKTHADRFESALLALDVVLAAWVFLAVFQLSGTRLTGGDAATLVVLAVAAVLTFPIAMSQVGLYASQRRSPLLRVLMQLAVTGAFTTALLVGLVLLLGRPEWAWWTGRCAFLQFAVFSVERACIISGLRMLRLLGRNVRKVVFVGTGPRAVRLVEEIDGHPEWGLQIAAFVDDGETASDPRLGREVVHKLSDFPKLMRRLVVDEVVIAVPRSQLQLAAPVVSECAQVGVPVTVPADLFGDFLPRPRLGRYGRLPMLHFSQVPQSRLDLALKRLLDISVAGLLLLATAPVVALAALAIRLTSPGPVFFRQVRCGLNGRRFEMLKLRSMVVGAELHHAELWDQNEMDGPVFKIRNDPRTTPVGRFLRRWSIDECPQFWNVLRGDMSLVGPRPPLPEEVRSYRNGERRRLSMRPGLTCLWQIGGRNDIGFEKWVELDLLYIDSWSLSLDLTILLRTPWAVLRRRGAC